MQGFFIEVNRAQADAVPPDYMRRQTVKSAERFITPELKSFEDKVLGARERALAREKELYDALLDELIAQSARAAATTAAPSRSSMCSSCFAERATTLDCVQPELVDEPMLHIDGGRHPVVERASREPFIPNDLRFDDARRMLIITGPNMGGKEHLHAPDGADRDSRAHRLFRAGDGARCSDRWIASSRASAPPTIWPAAARPSCSK